MKTKIMVLLMLTFSSFATIDVLAIPMQHKEPVPCCPGPCCPDTGAMKYYVPDGMLYQYIPTAKELEHDQ